MNISGLSGVLATLQSLPAEVVSKRGGPVKLALAKGARLIRDEAIKNLKTQIAVNGDQSTGLLEKNVIASRGKAIFGENGERYLVRVRRKTYPDRNTGKPVTTRKTASLLEYGSIHQPATPWMRPAVVNKGAEAIDVISKDLIRRLDLVVKKLAAQNQTK
ncbi:HK97-gp10 family putative phage morphogenesis protein [Paralcaligenes ginsengisoli]